MITVRYMGVDDLDPRLGPQVLQVVQPDLLHVHLSLDHIERKLIDPFDELSHALSSHLIPLDAPGEPWGRVMVMRECRPMTRRRPVRVEYVEGGVLWRFPRHHVSPLFAARMEFLGTHLYRSYAPAWLLDGSQSREAM